MNYYNNTTYCQFYLLCKTPCDKAMTIEVWKEAQKVNLPIETLTEPPECYKLKENN